MPKSKKPTVDALSVVDGWENVLTGLGTIEKDKREGAAPTVDRMTYETLSNLYRGSDLAARIVDLPAEDMMRECFDVRIEGDEEKAEEVGSALEDLEADAQIEQALKWARLYGGAAILIGVNDGVRDLAQPVNEKAIQAIDYLTPFDAFEARPIEWEPNPAKKGFSRATMFQVNPHTVGIGIAPLQRVHASRFLIFQGPLANRRQLREGTTGMAQGWGDSILMRSAKQIRDYDASWGGISHLLTDFAQAVYKIQGLAAALLADKDKTIKRRFQLINMARSIINATLLDKDGEDFERKTTSVAGVSDILREHMNRVSATAGIPTTVLFGISPGGQNSTGESDIQIWYDKVRALQRRGVKPQAHELARLLMLAKTGPTKGALPPKWNIYFPSLWQMSDTEKAEVRNKNAQTDQIYHGLGVASTEDIATSRWGGDEYGMDLVIDTAALEDRAAQAQEMADVTHETVTTNLQTHGQETPPKPAPVAKPKGK